MLASLLSRLFPVRLPKKIMKDDLGVSLCYRLRAHPFDGRNENPDLKLLDKSTVGPVSRMTALTYAPSLREQEIEREMVIRQAYTMNELPS